MFQVVDMRWGVRDEATDDHMTTELCMREIANCQRLSMGPNFVVSLYPISEIVVIVYDPMTVCIIQSKLKIQDLSNMYCD
jgi:hypothetical protein